MYDTVKNHQSPRFLKYRILQYLLQNLEFFEINFTYEISSWTGKRQGIC